MAEVDWVAARFACSVHMVFKRLELAVKSDVDKMNALDHEAVTAGGGRRTKSFEAVSKGKRLSVSRRDLGVNELQCVNFTLEDPEILVESDYDGGPAFKAGVRLNAAGDCILVVDGDELEIWQVRQMALDNLLFGGPSPRTVSVRASKKV